MITKRIKAVNVDFHETCSACPEQYDVYIDGFQIGYVRLRWGYLRCDTPDVGGRQVYSHEFDDAAYQGCFDSDDQRDYHLDLIAEILYNEYMKSEAVR